MIALAVLLVGYGFALWLRAEDGGELFDKSLNLAFVLLIPLGLYCFALLRRLEGPSLPQVLAQDARAPVLYLRPFSQESQFFVIGPKSELGTYARSLHAMMSEDAQHISVAFEEFFQAETESSRGPFIELGSPEDYVPPPGATRMYATDDEWMERLDDLARRARCIFVEVGKSDNLRWELERLKQNGLRHKLFVFTRPASSAVARKSYALRRTGVESIAWTEFADDLQQQRCVNAQRFSFCI